jgi:hypothetical protein
MAQAQVFLSSTNSFLPEATGQVISFVRDPKEFKINSWCQNIQSPKTVGVYAVLDRDRPNRVVTDAEFAWEDGDERPMGRANIGRFQWVSFVCYRRDYPFTLGEQAVEQATAYKPLQYEAASSASVAMVNRTNRIVTLCETAANWPSTNVDTANSLNGGKGKWSQASNDPSSGNYLAIKRTILTALQKLNLLTNAIVKPSDMVLVISPGAAIAMAETSEITDYISRSQFAEAEMRGDKPNVNQTWGLPSQLYGLPLVIEDCVRVTTRPNTGTDATSVTGGAGTRLYVKSDQTAFLVSRKGGLDGVYGSPSFSTVQCYFYRFELAVETFNDSRNKRVDGHVVEQFIEILAAPIAGYLIQSIT